MEEEGGHPGHRGGGGGRGELASCHKARPRFSHRP